MNFHGRPAYPIGFFATITIVIIAVSTTFLLWDLRVRELSHTRLAAIGITKIFVEQTERSFESADLVLRGVQDRLQSSFGNQFSLDSLQVHLMLGTRVLGMRQMDALYLVDANGYIVNSSIELPPQKIHVANREYYKTFLGKQDLGLFIGIPTRNSTTKEWTLNIARKITDPDGHFRGVIVGAIDIAHFEDIYKLLKLDYPRPVSLYRIDGTLIASFPHRENMIGEKPPELRSNELMLSSSEIVFAKHAKGVGGQEEFTLGRVPKFPLIVSVVNDEDEALASWRETAVPIVFGSILMSIFIIIAAGLLIREAMRQQKLADALGAAHNRYQHTIESVMDAIIAVDESHNIILFNPSAERMFGVESEDILGKPLLSLLPQRFRDAHNGHVQSFTHSNENSRTMGGPQLGIVGVRSDGTEFPIESTISQVVIDGKRQLTAVLRDVTERRRAENELREMNHQLRGLSAALEDIREQERARIARELHDDLGQQLTGLKLELSWLGNRIKDGRMPPNERIEEMRQQLDAAIASVRRISTELRPIILDDLGFEEAVNWLIKEFIKRTGIHVVASLEAGEYVKNTDLATAMFRIVQESLTNIARYAQANRVDVLLTMSERVLILTITDDGIGMDGELNVGGFGLVSMRERARALGGHFSIVSGNPNGVTIRVEFPLNLPIFTETAV